MALTNRYDEFYSLLWRMKIGGGSRLMRRGGGMQGSDQAAATSCPCAGCRVLTVAARVQPCSLLLKKPRCAERAGL